MKRKALHIFTLILLVAICSQVGLGGEARHLTLAEALAIGKESDLEIRLAAIKLENAGLEQKKAKAADALLVSRQADLQHELSRIRAEENYLQTQNKVFLEIARGYLDVLKSEAEVGLRLIQVQWEEGALEELEAQVEKGYKTRLELLQQRNKYHGELLGLKKAEKNRIQLYSDLLLRLGVEPGIELVMAPTPSAWTRDLEDARELAIENSLSLRILDMEVEIAKADLERAEIGPTLELERTRLRNNLETALINRERSTADLMGSVQRQRASLRQAEEELTLNQANLLIVKENYQLILRQETAGLINRLDRLSAEKELLQAEYQNLTAVAGVYLEKWKLQQLIGLELEV